MTNLENQSLKHRMELNQITERSGVTLTKASDKMNTQTKHTPGPWTFKLHDGWNSLTYAIYQDKGKESGYCVAEKKWSSINNIQMEELKANARLIAAAPELLEACKDAIEFIKDGYVETFPEVKQLLNKLEQAIAKAEGA